MIKINLLPTKRKPARKVTELQKQLIIAVVVLGGVITGMGFYFITLNNKIAARTEEKAAAPRSGSSRRSFRTGSRSPWTSLIHSRTSRLTRSILMQRLSAIPRLLRRLR